MEGKAPVPSMAGRLMERGAKQDEEFRSLGLALGIGVS